MKQLVWLFLLIIGLSLPLRGETIADNNNYLLKLPVTSMEITGNPVSSSNLILQQAGLKTRVGYRTDNLTLQEDLHRIMSQGFFHKVDLELEPYDSGVKVIFVVKENPVLGEITFHDNVSFPAAKLRQIMKTKVHHQLDFNLLAKDVKRINTFYKNNYYELSSVSKMELSSLSTLNVFISEPYIKEIIITGNIYTNTELIKREFSLQPGSIYNSKKMQESRNRIFGLGYFSLVSLPEILPADEAGAVNIKINVAEKKKNNLNFGLGFTSNEKFAFATLSFLNIFNTGEQIFFTFQTGQEYLQANKYAKISYRFRYYNPWVLQKDLSFGYTKYLGVAFESLRNGTEIVDTLPIRRDGFSLDWGFPLPFGREYRFISEYKDETVEEVGASPRVKYMNKSLAGTYLYNGLEMLPGSAVVIDGESFRLRLEKGGLLEFFRNVSIGLGGVEFTRVDLQYSRFTPLTEQNNIIGFSYKTGSFVSARQTNVLEGEEYTVGGANTVRGYADSYPFAVGPKMTLVNLEYRYLFSPQLQGVLFYDWGNAYTDVNVSMKDFKSGYGFGLRFTTLIGPLRFDLGRGESYWIFHFGLGYTF